MNIPNEIKCTLVQQQIERWTNTHYNASITVRVAKTIEDMQMEAEAKNLMKRALKALDELEKVLEELSKDPIKS